MMAMWKLSSSFGLMAVTNGPHGEECEIWYHIDPNHDYV
jgi:hypothetical protein